ncbi:MAG: translation initiation factor IF-2 subunit beta [Candidatus Altiarchaeota archaeon]|nr:translation initiation factor IF-2 subunit beta [Candidatus Altiarchaeota archaeon]
MDYDLMLKRAYKKMPPIVFEKKRFDVPKVSVSVEGNKTIFNNFSEIVDYISRDENHILKYIGREMGAAWRREGSRVILVGKFGSHVISQKLEKYIKNYVICSVCDKPDTKLIKQDRILMLKCMACGATNSVPQ